MSLDVLWHRYESVIERAATAEASLLTDLSPEDKDTFHKLVFKDLYR